MTCERLGHDRIAVDGERDRLPDAEVVEAEVAASPVEPQVEGRGLRELDDDEAGVGLQPLDLARGRAV
jgi:hypothetical protein